MFGFRNKMRCGITLAELLVVFIIMGVVASMMIVSSKPLEKSIRYSYTRTLNTLGIALYNSMINPAEAGVKADELDGTFPKTSEALCKMLTSYINTSAASNNCSGNVISLESYKTVGTLNSLFKSQKPHFIASNGVKYWIVTPVTANAKTFSTATFGGETGQNDINKDSFSVKYYVIVADVNGSIPPNSTEYTKGKMADIVAFILTEDADVVPIGPPVYDTRYLTSRVVYSTTSGVESDALNSSETVSFMAAQRKAWANSAAPGAIKISKDNPLSLNFYQYNKSNNRNGVKIGDAFPSGTAFSFSIPGDTTCTSERVADIPDICDQIKLKHDKWCSLDPEKSDSEVDTTACYVRISDFN